MPKAEPPREEIVAGKEAERAELHAAVEEKRAETGSLQAKLSALSTQRAQLESMLRLQPMEVGGELHARLRSLRAEHRGARQELQELQRAQGDGEGASHDQVAYWSWQCEC